MFLNVTEGRGCDHCEVGYPITFVQTSVGLIRKCLECTLEWTGWTLEQFELFHRPFRDHISDAVKKAFDREMELAKQAYLNGRA